MKKVFVSCFFIATFGALYLSSCKKDSYSKVPVIKFISMTPNPAIKYQDTIKMVISYTDGDGDLGENTPDAKNLFVTDNRNKVTSQFRIPQLAPDNANIIIHGNLDVILSPQGFIDDNNETETAEYSIYVKDRAGNQSNIIQTNTLTINKQ